MLVCAPIGHLVWRCLRAALTALFLASLFAVGRAQADDIAIDGPVALNAALVAVVAGTTLVLAPGDYGALSLRGGGGAVDFRPDGEKMGGHECVECGGEMRQCGAMQKA